MEDKGYLLYEILVAINCNYFENINLLLPNVHSRKISIFIVFMVDYFGGNGLSIKNRSMLSCAFLYVNISIIHYSNPKAM